LCGIFSLTDAAEFTLRVWGVVQRIASAELIYESCQFQQIRHAEERTILSYDDPRIRSHQIRPLWRNRADRRIIDVQQKTSSVTVVPLAHASELLAAERVEWMGDAHTTRRYDCSTCIGLSYKRLEEGTYAVPFGDAAERRREITAQELGALLSGIDLENATRRKRYRRAV
jgi:hypothetical protein